jgi:hypothetical protein
MSVMMIMRRRNSNLVAFIYLFLLPECTILLESLCGAGRA